MQAFLHVRRLKEELSLQEWLQVVRLGRRHVFADCYYLACHESQMEGTKLFVLFAQARSACFGNAA